MTWLPQAAQLTLTTIAALAATQALKTSIATQNEVRHLAAIEAEIRHENLSPTKNDLVISFVKEESGTIGVISASRSYRLTVQPITSTRDKAFMGTTFILPANQFRTFMVCPAGNDTPADRLVMRFEPFLWECACGCVEPGHWHHEVDVEVVEEIPF